MAEGNPPTALVPGPITSLSMGPVHLNVRNMAVMRAFYADLVGLDVLQDGGGRVTVGHGGLPVVVLHHAPSVPSPPAGSAGLYHLAVLFSSRGALARSIVRILARSPDLFTGSADHLVSEAFYFSDPEGNGVELYADRDPAGWTWQGGKVVMDSRYLPVDDFVRRHAAEAGDGHARIGHVHLKVGDVEEADAFYVGIVGLTLTARMPSALFASVNRYHHHLGLNTWESVGAPRRSETLGLRHFELLLPASDVGALARRLADAGLHAPVEDGILRVADPWGNLMVVRTRIE